jgi:hypothetical protein
MRLPSADFEGTEAIYVQLLWSAPECVRRDSDKGSIDLDYPRDVPFAPGSGHREVTEMASTC